MSYSVNKLDACRVIDPLVDINETKVYAFVQGGEQVSYKSVVSTSFSNNSAQFSAPPPNPGIIIDRLVWLRIPITIHFEGTPGDPFINLLQSGYDGWRAFPILSILNTMTITLNNTSVSINSHDEIIPLLRYMSNCEFERFFSVAPCELDSTQEYSDLVNSIRNPLGFYGDSLNSNQEHRGAFRYITFVNNNLTADISAIITEPLFLSPFIFSSHLDNGFLGLQTMDVTLNYNNNLSRVWCHSNASTNTLDLIDVQLGQPSLLFKYITPQILMKIPRTIDYDFNIINRYPTNASSFEINEQRLVASNNIQLQTIPEKIYIFARRSNQLETFLTTDTYLSIVKINVNFNNRSGLMSNMTEEQLYEMSVKNGCNMSYQQWSGGPTNLFLGNSLRTFGTVGSIVCIKPAEDFGLQSLECSGLDGTYQLQIDVTLVNKNQSSSISDVSLYIMVVDSGSFTIIDQRAIQQIGIISKSQILDAQKSPTISYKTIRHMQGYGSEGGDFFQDVRSIGENVIRNLPEFARKGIKFVKEDLLPIAKEIIPLILPLLAAAGEGDYNYEEECDIDYGGARRGRKKKAPRRRRRKMAGDGFVVKGGELISKKQMRDLISDLTY